MTSIQTKEDENSPWVLIIDNTQQLNNHCVLNWSLMAMLRNLDIDVVRVQAITFLWGERPGDKLARVENL